MITKSARFQRFCQVFSLVAICFFVPDTAAIHAAQPVSHFDRDTYVYLEIYPAKVGLKKIRQLFFSMMNKEKAKTEWASLEEYFSQDIGINLLSPESLASSGFSINHPIGLGIHYSLEKINNGRGNTSLKYKSNVTLLLPAHNPAKAYAFFKDVFKRSADRPRPQGPNYAADKISVRELEKDRFLTIMDPARNGAPLYIYRGEDSLVVSENIAFAKKYAAVSSTPLEKNAAYLESKKQYENNKYKNDMVCFFFINQKISDENTRINPRLLFDNILMDNTYIKELSANSDYISGAMILHDQGLKVRMNYTFPQNYLKGGSSFLAETFNFKNQSFFPDNLTALPMAFLKWQTNFPGNGNGNHKSILSNQTMESFIGKLTGGLPVVVPEGIKSLFKDNISLYVQEIPPLKDINNYYLWKGYLGIHYNPAEFEKFRKLMDNLVASSAKSKNVKIEYSKTGDKFQWQFAISRFIKRYDKVTGQVVYDEKIHKMFVWADSNQIIITHDPQWGDQQPPRSSSPLHERLLPEKNPGKLMIFSYLDTKKFLSHIAKSSLVLTENYFSYFENLKSMYLLVSQENDTITEELLIMLDNF